MVISTLTISQSVCRLFTSVLINSEFIAIGTPPSLCHLLFGVVSFQYTVNRVAGTYSEVDIEGSSQRSVPIMVSGFVVSRSKSSSAGFFMFYRLKIQANNF